MKKIFVLALLSAVISVPAVADDTSAKEPIKKSTPAKPAAHMQDNKKMGMDDECDTRHPMGGLHHGHGMIGEQGAGMMMEPDMHLPAALDVSKEQQSGINKLSDELKHKNWAAQGLINDETAKLRDLYEADKRDPAAIGKEYQNIFDLERKMIESYLDTQNRIEEILTPGQRAKLKEIRDGMRHMHGHSM